MVQVEAAGGSIPQLGVRRWKYGARGPPRADSLTLQAAESAWVALDDLGRVLAPFQASVSPAPQCRGRCARGSAVKGPRFCKALCGHMHSSHCLSP